MSESRVKAYHLNIALLIAYVVGCGSANNNAVEQQMIRATWSADQWFAIPTTERTQLSEQAADQYDVFWVVGDGVSAPLDVAPAELPNLTTAEKVPLEFPDVMVPDTIAAGTVLSVHAVKDGKILDEVAATLIIQTETETAYAQWYYGLTMQRSQCYSYPSFLCTCQQCSGVTVISTTRKQENCNGYSLCNNGGNHACWTRKWSYNCYG